MLYHSTRNASVFVDSAQAVLDGLAPDGGLYMPRQLPAFDWQACLEGDTYHMANAILSALLPDIPNMESLVSKAYTGKFQTEELTPTVSVGDFTVLELFRGPTSAFKDVALCMLPQLLTAAKTEKGMDSDIMILTATSGDTGKAALAGFRDVPGVRICVFYPEGGVSAVQRAQMVTQEGNNVTVSAVVGNFDDAQTGVKNIFAACGDGKLLEDKSFRLSSANSINIGRLAPQVTYYFKAYRDLLDRGTVKMGDEVNFCVPPATSATFWQATWPRSWVCPWACWSAPATPTMCLPISSAPASTTGSGPCTKPPPPPWTSWCPATWSDCCI